MMPENVFAPRPQDIRLVGKMGNRYFLPMRPDGSARTYWIFPKDTDQIGLCSVNEKFTQLVCEHAWPVDFTAYPEFDAMGQKLSSIYPCDIGSMPSRESQAYHMFLMVCSKIVLDAENNGDHNHDRAQRKAVY